MLLTTTLQLKEHIGGLLDKDMTFDLIRPFVFDAQAQLVGPILGEALFTILEGDSLSTLHQTVKLSAQRAIAWTAYQEAQVSFLYQFGNSGLTKFNGKSAEKLALWEVDTILADTARKADAAQEQLMECLSRHKAQLPEWTSSDAYKRANALLIPTTQLLNEALPEVSATHSMLAKLQIFMPRTERRYIAGLLGADLFAELKAKLASNTELSGAETELYQRCRDVLAPVTLWEALPSMAVRFFDDGIRIISSFKGLKDQKSAPVEQINELRANLWTQYEAAQGELKCYLNETASATVFEGYFNSDLYVVPGPAQWREPDNEGRKHFRM